MSAERLVEGLGRRLSRRRFLARLGAGAVGGALALLGLPRVAGATYPNACCNLCNIPSPSCSGCACSWCWTCADCAFNGTYQCCECYNSSGTCAGDCGNVICSWYYKVNNICVPTG